MPHFKVENPAVKPTSCVICHNVNINTVLNIRKILFLFLIHPPSPFADVINGWYLRRIRKGSLPSNDEKQTNQQQPFRFPAFEVIDIRPDIAPTNALDRLWLRVTAPHFNSQVDLKVS